MADDDGTTALRESVVAACHRLADAGLLVGTAGNVSARAGDRVAITATGTMLAGITVDQVVVVDRDGAVVEGGVAPTSEVDLHLGVYEAYDAGAVVHTHAPVSTAASISATEIPVIHYQQLLLGGAIRVAAYATFGTAELARNVRSALDGRNAALMANHGAVTHGATVDQAVENSLLLEWLCTVYRDALTFGRPRTLSRKALEDVARVARERRYGTVQE